MSAYLFNNSTLYPQLIVELGIPDAASSYAEWGGGTWDTSTWAPATVWTDITDYVRSLSTSWARSRELNRQPSNTLSIVLSNRDGRFSPGNLSGPYVVAGISQIRPRVQIRVRATWSSVTYPIFYGFVSNWQDSTVGNGKDLVTTVTASDVLSLLAITDLDGNSIGIAGDNPQTRIGQILSSVQWAFDSVLDLGTVGLQVDTSRASALSLCNSVADSDGGLVFADRDGTLRYHARWHRGPYFSGPTSTSTVTIGTGSKTLTTQAGHAFRTGDRLLIVNQANYENMVGSVTSYNATTGSLTVNISSTTGSSTGTAWWIAYDRSIQQTITFGSTGSDNRFDEPQLSNDDTLIYNQINVTGNGLTTQTASDNDSIALYGVRSLSVDGWMQTTAEASALAAWWLSVTKNPEYRVDSIRVTPASSPSTLWPLILDAQIADRHRVKIAIPGGGTIDRYVHVSGISHSISQADGWRAFFDYSSAAAF